MDELKTSDVSAMLNLYLKNRDIELRNELVLQYLFIVKNVAKSTRGLYANYATFDDIVNHGIITLIDCLERYDQSKNMDFEPYAYVRIRNATIDYIRKSDFLPRRVRQNARTINQTYNDLSNTLMREPSDAELAAHMNISVDELSRHYGEVANSQLLSMEEITAYVSSEDGIDISSDSSDPKVIFAQKELREQMKQAISVLTEREQIVISLYYYENLKFKEIAQILDVSEARISQIHTKILVKLKEHLQHKKED